MKTPHFENCQVALNPDGSIYEVSKEFCDWIGISSDKVIGESFRQLMLGIEQSWDSSLPTKLYSDHEKFFLPLVASDRTSSIGLHITLQRYEKLKVSILSITTGLAPHDSLKDVFLGDLM